jgi:hypothetical protein
MPARDASERLIEIAGMGSWHTSGPNFFFNRFPLFALLQRHAFKPSQTSVRYQRSTLGVAGSQTIMLPLSALAQNGRIHSRSPMSKLCAASPI